MHDGPHWVNWSHDTFTWKSAIIELGKFILKDGYNYNNNRIMTWDLFNFVTPGTYDWDNVLDLTIVNYDWKKLASDTDQYIIH